MRVVARIPGAVVEHFQIISVLAMGLTCFDRIRIDQGAAVKWCKQPFVGIDNKAVCHFNPVEQGSRRRGGQRGPTVGAVNVKPNTLLRADVADTLHVINHAQGGGPCRARYRK